MKKFDGPIFIVGMPRSGTKLLRSLLNNHSQLAFPSYETQFLPYWVDNWEEYRDLTNFNHFQKFFNEVKKHSFFTYMEKRESKVITAKEWHQACKGGSVAEVFEALIRIHTDCSEDMIWGDKSPSYIEHIPLLKAVYPGAKVIHIIRDVRDYCLSINNAWGKNMVRAAQRWQDDTAKASLDVNALGSDGLQVRFEDLLSDPKTVLYKLCTFLEVTYEEAMIILDSPTENLGEARGELKIVATNKEKWRTRMQPNLIKKIESICASQLAYFKYPIDYKGEEVRISKFRLSYYRILDGLNLVISDTENRGIFKNLIFYLRDNKINKPS